MMGLLVPIDPHFVSLRSTPLPRSTGERKDAKVAAGISSLPGRGRGAERSEAVRGCLPASPWRAF
jgi:hypothetical protein